MWRCHIIYIKFLFDVYTILNIFPSGYFVRALVKSNTALELLRRPLLRDRKTVRSAIDQSFDSALSFIRGLTMPTLAPLRGSATSLDSFHFRRFHSFLVESRSLNGRNDRLSSFSPLFSIRVICVAPPLSQHPSPFPPLLSILRLLFHLVARCFFAPFDFLLLPINTRAENWKGRREEATALVF